MMDSNHSVTNLISAAYKHGDEEALNRLISKFLEVVAETAKKTYENKFKKIPRRNENEEDAVQSALGSFIKGIRQQKYSKLTDRNSLKNLLIKITIGKIYDQRTRANAKKRKGKISASKLTDTDEAAEMEQYIDDMPGPQAAAELREICNLALEMLKEPLQRQIADFHLQGLSCPEIAKKTNLSQRTIFRKLEIIHEIWKTRFKNYL